MYVSDLTPDDSQAQMLSGNYYVQLQNCIGWNSINCFGSKSMNFHQEFHD